MPARLRAVVQHPDNLDQTRRDCAKIDDVHRPSRRRVRGVTTGVPYVKTSDTGQELGTVPRCGPFGIGRYPSHRRCEKGGVPVPAFDAPSLGARRQNVREIGLRRA